MINSTYASGDMVYLKSLLKNGLVGKKTVWLKTLPLQNGVEYELQQESIKLENCQWNKRLWTLILPSQL